MKDRSELVARQAVDDEVDAAVEEDEVPGGQVRHELPLRYGVGRRGEDTVDNQAEPA